MSLQTPTTSEINAAIIAQLEAQLNQTIPALPKSFLRVLARVLSGVFVLLYKYGGFIFQQMFVQTASDQETEVNGVLITPLTFWGRLIGVGDPVAATNAELTVQVTVLNQTGQLPSGTQLVNTTNGVTYITIGGTPLNAPTVNATIRASADQTGGGGAGAIGNLDPGAIVSFANPLANVAQDTVVLTQDVTGADGESTEAYRQRIIDQFQKRPQGGALLDYERWSEEVAGIVRAYPYTGANPGQVEVYIEATPESSGDPDGIPTPAQLQEVLDSINFDNAGLANRRPANAFPFVFGITRTSFDVTVTGLVVDDLGSTQAAINQAIDEYFTDAEPFIQGVTLPPRKDRLAQSAIIGIVDDIVTAFNGTFTTATFELTSGGGPITDYTLGKGEKSKVTGVTYA